MDGEVVGLAGVAGDVGVAGLVGVAGVAGRVGVAGAGGRDADSCAPFTSWSISALW